MKEIFFNSSSRLRSGWRAVIFFSLFVVLSLISGSFLFLIANSITGDGKSFLNSQAGFVINMFFPLLIAIGLGWLCGKLLEDLPLKALGWVFNKTWIKDYLFGLFLGILTLTAAVLIAMPTGGISLTLNQTASSQAILMTFISSFIVFFIGAAFEETLFRGYILQTLFRSNHIILGILFTSVLFALVHSNNPNVSQIGLFNTVLAGIWFGVAYLKTRSLWLAFGLHLSWNWFQGAFFGINVSGLSEIAPNPFLQIVDNGPAWLTGGSYGIEGGITCTITIILSTILIWFLPILKPTEEMLALTSKENSNELT